MQYVRGLSESVSTAWNSINPATLSGAIDVIVVEQEDGTLACSPFHVRFGKFSLLRPYEKKVDFVVNGVKQPYAMKLGEGGEAFFVFETTENIPKAMQTSPLTSPMASPIASPTLEARTDNLLGIDGDGLALDDDSSRMSPNPSAASVRDENMTAVTPLSSSPDTLHERSKSTDWPGLLRPRSDEVLGQHARTMTFPDAMPLSDATNGPRSGSPPAPGGPQGAVERAKALSRELSAANIPSQVTETGDLMLDMTGFKANDEDAFRAEILARRILSEELDGNYDVGSLFALDEQGNLWIYASQEAKAAAAQKSMEQGIRHTQSIPADAASDPGYQSDGSEMGRPALRPRAESDASEMDYQGPDVPRGATAGDPNRNYAKTLRLTSDQLKALNLKRGENTVSFTVNRATCTAFMFLWKHDEPVVISDIDGTITKSDALGHVLNMIGRDWTHSGVAKLYSDIVANGYNIMYLTSRSVGQADTTRAYLGGITQDNYKLPRGPTILSPDRTFSALRREIYLRKPHVFKMATLRDIRNLYGVDSRPFYAGFGNRLTDQISYRTVDVPRNRIFTINSNAEVSMDLLSLNTMKLTYVNINEVVDHYFPPVQTMVRGGAEEYTDFTYWREPVRELDEFSMTEDEDDEGDEASLYDDGDDEEEEEEEEEDEEDDDEEDEEEMEDSIYVDTA